MTKPVEQTEHIEKHIPRTYFADHPASLNPDLPLNATTADEKVPSGFETNAGSFKGGKNRASSESKDEQTTKTREGFREFKNERQGGARYVPPEEPTPERKNKGDRPKKTKGGFYRAPPPIERLRDRNMLDADPRISEAMFQAGNKLYEHFYEAGLNGVAAQDLSREVHGSGGSSASHFPRTERAMHHRQTFRSACDAMGWHTPYPQRGAGRVVVDVCCYQIGVKDAAKVHVAARGNEASLAVGLDRLREGLFALAKYWKFLN